LFLSEKQIPKQIFKATAQKPFRIIG